jgi:hypothetical protein
MAQDSDFHLSLFPSFEGKESQTESLTNTLRPRPLEANRGLLLSASHLAPGLSFEAVIVGAYLNKITTETYDTSIFVSIPYFRGAFPFKLMAKRRFSCIRLFIRAQIPAWK